MLVDLAFTIAIVIVSWVPACTVTFDMVAISGVCFPPSTVLWTQTGYAICMLLSDVLLTVLPWMIIQKVQYIPAREKWGVATAMSFVGVAGLVELARYVPHSHYVYRWFNMSN